MKKLLVLSSYFLLLLALPLRAQVPDSLPHLGDSAFAALITCGPGEEFYTSFGHSALRICDSTQGIDNHIADKPQHMRGDDSSAQPYFNLQGLRVLTPQHGHIYIRGGRKIIY